MHGEEVAEYYTTTETLSSPDTKLDYFVGDISTARCYAFWVEKDYNNVDISYSGYAISFCFCSQQTFIIGVYMLNKIVGTIGANAAIDQLALFLITI